MDLDYQLCEMFAIQVASTRVSGCAKCERRGNRGGLGLSTLSCLFVIIWIFVILSLWNSF